MAFLLLDVMAVDPPPLKHDSASASHAGGGVNARHGSTEVEHMKSLLGCQEIPSIACVASHFAPRMAGARQNVTRGLCLRLQGHARWWSALAAP